MQKVLIFDLEALGNRPSSIILDIAAVLVDLDTEFTFKDLVNSDNVFYRKVSADSQKGRTVDKSTLEWWEKQSDEAKRVAKRSSKDVDVKQAILDFEQFLLQQRFNIKYDLAYCRGQSYDFPIIADIVHTLLPDMGYEYSMFPCAFWNQRDLRTAISHVLLKPEIKKVPIGLNELDGFIKHNSIHDCCKDAVLLQRSMQYAKGVKEIPADFELV